MIAQLLGYCEMAIWDGIHGGTTGVSSNTCEENWQKLDSVKGKWKEIITHFPSRCDRGGNAIAPTYVIPLFTSGNLAHTKKGHRENPSSVARPYFSKVSAERGERDITKWDRFRLGLLLSFRSATGILDLHDISWLIYFYGRVYLANIVQTCGSWFNHQINRNK